jgi:hypothetical protein
MKVQDVDAQPLRYGRHQYRGAVQANRYGDITYFAYFKPVETLNVRRGTPKTITRERQLNPMLRQMWFGFRFHAKMAFPKTNLKHMFIYFGNVCSIRPNKLPILTPSLF